MVKLQVFDCMGRVVKVLADNEMPQGDYQVSFNAGKVPSGLYLIQLVTGNNIQTRKCLIEK